MIYKVPVHIHLDNGAVLKGGHTQLNEQQYIAFLKQNKNREYYEKFKQKLNEKHKCEVCGGFYTKHNKTKHLSTKKHLKAA